MSALRKGFSIIEAVTAAGNDGLPFSQIVAETGVAKATAHRLLAELVDMSLLTLDPTTRCYRGGLSLARIGATVTADYDLRTSAHPHLQALHDEFGHVATLGVRNKLTGVYIDKIESRDFGLRLHSEIGKTFPLHCTAMGKVLLSQADKDTVRRITKRKLEAHTANTITDPKALRRELRRVAEQGYAVDDEEITRGLVCIAAPVLGIGGEIAGAMSCTFPSYIAEENGLQPAIDAVRRFAALASAG
ncbi:MAG: IclR family transcriptional regulator [Woeseiaceae bacterium]